MWLLGVLGDVTRPPLSHQRRKASIRARSQSPSSAFYHWKRGNISSLCLSTWIGTHCFCFFCFSLLSLFSSFCSDLMPSSASMLRGWNSSQPKEESEEEEDPPADRGDDLWGWTPVVVVMLRPLKRVEEMLTIQKLRFRTYILIVLIRDNKNMHIIETSHGSCFTRKALDSRRMFFLCPSKARG